jgi:hypothetical protein
LALDKYIGAIYSFARYQDFDWDDWNIKKNWEKHQTTPNECVQVFADLQKRIYHDPFHPAKEAR